ncbi:hypothetical protein, partial [Rhizobium sp. 12,4]|uniref:hypothetical protein n=1 Tax=Rhizobium sp. 12,4 TaxID=3405135 RepID=UPI003D3554A0
KTSLRWSNVWGRFKNRRGSNRSRMKIQWQVRENKFVKCGDDADPERDNFPWYYSDTASGSSGAAAFTDA